MNRARLLGLATACLMLRQAGLLSEGHAQQNAPFPAARIAGTFRTASFSPDSTVLAIKMWPSEDFRGLKVLEVPSARELASLPYDKGTPDEWGGRFAVGFSPDGRTFAWAEYHGTISLWRITPEEWEMIDEIGIDDPRQGSTPQDARRATLQFATFSVDGRLLAWDGWNRVVIWDVHSRKEAGILPVDGTVGYLGFSPDGQLLKAFILTRLRAKWCYQRRLWNASTFEPHGRPEQYPVGTHPSGKLPNMVRFSPDGNLMAELLREGEAVKLVDTTTGQSASCPGFPPPAPQVLLTHNPQVDFWVKSRTTVSTVAISPDNGTLAVGMNYGGTVVLWNRAGGSPTARLDHPAASSVWPHLFSPDGRYLLTFAIEGTPAPKTGQPPRDQVAYLWDLRGHAYGEQASGTTLP